MRRADSEGANGTLGHLSLLGQAPEGALESAPVFAVEAD